jgi:hypothetical protein
MKKYEYEILVGRSDPNVSAGVIWFRSSNLNLSLGPNLPRILNDMGHLGWEVVALGDIGFDSKSEIILKRELT